MFRRVESVHYMGDQHRQDLPHHAVDLWLGNVDPTMAELSMNAQRHQEPFCKDTRLGSGVLGHRAYHGSSNCLRGSLRTFLYGLGRGMQKEPSRVALSFEGLKMQHGERRRTDGDGCLKDPLDRLMERRGRGYL